MSDTSAPGPPVHRRGAAHVPHQAPPVERAVSSAALADDRGVDADLFGLPVGDWLEAPGKYVWDNYAKGWLNT